LQTSAEFVRQGQAALTQNQPDAARAAFEQALVCDQDCLDAHLALTQLRFPGEHYYDLLGRLHAALRPQTYVEIGVETGASMARALAGTKCVGIDPQPRLSVKGAVEPMIFAMTSGEFFAKHSLTDILDGVPVELGFIDGMHVFENTLEDFVNLERFCAPGGTMVFHDCLPLNELTAARHRQTRFWTGDVWRVLPALARFRPDLSITVVECPPSGLAVVRGLDPKAPYPVAHYERAVTFGHSLPFAATRNLGDFGIKVVANDWREIDVFTV
jgi:hypothetical protein